MLTVQTMSTVSVPDDVSDASEVLISLRKLLRVKPNTMAETEFSCAFTDGFTIKHFAAFLESLDVHTIYFTFSDKGFVVNQVNKRGDDPDVYIHWEVDREDLIMYRFHSKDPVSFGIQRKDLSAKMKGLPKNASVGFEKVSGKNTLSILIGPKLEKWTANHFGTSVNIPLVNTRKEEYATPEMLDDESLPIVALTLTHLGFILGPVVQPHLKKKAEENAALDDRFDITVYSSSLLIRDAVYQGDGLVFGEMQENDSPVTRYSPRVWNLSKMNVLARGCVPGTLVRFYANDKEPLMLKIFLGTFSTLRLFFLPGEESDE